MRCVSYTRYVASKPEKEIPPDIISQQTKRIEDYAVKHGWTIERKYSDRKNDKTAEAAFLQMKNDGMARRFDMVITDSFFRLGRNNAAARNLLQELFFPAGIHIAVVEDDFCSIGKSAEEVERYVRRKYAEVRTVRRWTAIMDDREQGHFNVHDERYGYLLSEDRRELVIDKEAAVVIREVFQLIAEGNTMKAVAEKLNQKGYEPPALHLERVSQKHRFKGRSTVWTANIVKTVTSCEQYLGKATKKVHDRYIEYSIPAIVDREVYDKAKAQLRKHYHGSPKNKVLENIFKFIIRDRETEQSLICITDRNDKSIRNFCIGRKSGDPTIPYETVVSEVTAVLKNEVRQAQKIAALLAGEEGRIAYEDRKQVIVSDMRGIMNEISEIAEMRIRLDGEEDAYNNKEETEQKLSVLEERFVRKQKEWETLKKAFSKNPWIETFSAINIDDGFDNSQIRKWIETVWIQDFRGVTVDFKLRVWRDMLPAEWREGEKKHGA